MTVSSRAEKRIGNHLRAILDAATDLVDEVGIPDTAADLRDGPRIRQLAFCECVRRAGEAVAQIDAIDDAWLATTFPGIPWRDVKAARNLLTHHFWVVDYTILHRIGVVHLRELTAPIAEHLDLHDPCAADSPGDQVGEK